MRLPSGRVLRLVTPVLGVFTPVAAGMAFALDFASFQNLGCQVPGVRSACGSFGWGGVPSREQDLAWAVATKRDDGDGLRAYLRRWPRGAYAGEAQARLAGCRAAEVEEWSPSERRLPLRVGLGDPTNGEAAARADAIRRGARDAEGLCVAYKAGEYRLTAGQAEPRAWTCATVGGGQTCGFEGEAVCRVEVRRVDVQEVCR